MNKNNMNHTMIHRIVLAAASLVLLCSQHVAGQTMRGDFNMDGSVNLTDVTTMISYMINERLPYAEPVKDTVTVNGVPFVMVRVQGGAYSRELYTSHTVGDFSIGLTEVTVEQWNAVMTDEPINDQQGQWKQCPASNMNWTACQRFVTRINELTGLQFSLPTEDEWEYAAGGGRLTRAYHYAGSNTPDDVAWHMGNAGTSYFYGLPVATKAPNELGLYDMSGNVWEWCLDNRDYPNTTYFFAMRGGCVSNTADKCKVTSKINMRADTDENNGIRYGFRLVLHSGQ